MAESMRIDATQVLKNLASNGEVEKRMKAAVGLYCDSTGKKMGGYAKDNAPWTDRTGNARQSIDGGFKWDGDKCMSYVSGNMDYSPYLELAHANKNGDDIPVETTPSFAKLELAKEGKYAILRPTVRKFVPNFISGMNNLLGK